ncbi:hypothetical protein KBD71_02450 [Candidatus Woesebacteria bacterium]|nr:hypothetical protein [Candidatus Woesebacteria bacterium]
MQKTQGKSDHNGEASKSTQVAVGLAGAAVGAAVGAAAAVILTDEKKRAQLTHAVQDLQEKGKVIQEKVQGRLDEMAVEVEQGAHEVRKQLEEVQSSAKKTTTK